MFETPILIIAFNRPALTKALIERVLQISPKKVYFAVDGARVHKPGESQLVDEVKALKNLFPSYTNLSMRFSELNQGCRKGVTNAIDWFFSTEHSGIILEDDCLPNISFFKFCELLLEKYAHEDRIGMISGDNFSFGRLDLKDSYYFSKYFHIWGWATWARSWKRYKKDKPDLREVQTVLSAKGMAKLEREAWQKLILAAYDGEIDTWDFQWVYTNWYYSSLAIMPGKNLIQNIGFGNDATHTHEANAPLSNLKTEEISFPLRHPKKIKASRFADYFSMRTFHNPNIFRKIEHRIASIIRRVLL